MKTNTNAPDNSKAEKVAKERKENSMLVIKSLANSIRKMEKLKMATPGYVNEVPKRPYGKGDDKQLMEVIPLWEDKIFSAVKSLEKGWALYIGRYRLGEWEDTFEKVERDSLNITWMRIMQVVQASIENQIRKEPETEIKEKGD